MAILNPQIADVCKVPHKALALLRQGDRASSCAAEAMEFGELEMEFCENCAVVLGISRYDFLVHGAFRDRHGLAVQLLTDVDGQLCRSYGVVEQ